MDILMKGASGLLSIKGGAVREDRRPINISYGSARIDLTADAWCPIFVVNEISKFIVSFGQISIFLDGKCAIEINEEYYIVDAFILKDLFCIVSELSLSVYKNCGSKIRSIYLRDSVVGSRIDGDVVFLKLFGNDNDEIAVNLSE